MWKCPSELKRPTARSQLLCQSSDASREPSTSGNNLRLLRCRDSLPARLTFRHREQKYREKKRNMKDTNL